MPLKFLKFFLQDGYDLTAWDRRLLQKHRRTLGDQHRGSDGNTYALVGISRGELFYVRLDIAVGFHPRGFPPGRLHSASERPRTVAATQLARRVGWLFLGSVELYDLAELGLLHSACIRVAKRGGDHGDVRAEAGRQAPLVPRWDVYETDRDGRHTLRVWRLPRLLGAGLAVFDHTSHPRGRYEVVTVGQGNVAITTGFHFSTLATLSAHLRTGGAQ